MSEDAGKPRPSGRGAVTKGEREDLQRLIRQREKVLKSAAKQRSAELLAQFENDMGQEFSFDQDEIWAEAKRLAKIEVAKAQKVVEARCRELGIPDEFAPSLNLIWSHRGYENATEKRRRELSRRMATKRIEAIESKACTEIELSCLRGQEQIALSGLGSDAAKAFIEQLPGIDALMPALSFDEIAWQFRSAHLIAIGQFHRDPAGPCAAQWGRDSADRARTARRDHGRTSAISAEGGRMTAPAKLDLAAAAAARL